MFFKKNEQQKIDLVTSCSTCGKPIANKLARTDVTRFLFQESRCQCSTPDSTAIAQINSETENVALPNFRSNLSKLSDSQDENPALKSVAGLAPVDWKSAALDNLPEYFEILSLIGEGGMGAVYKVLDKRLNKMFAVKILRPQFLQDSDAVHRFEQEAKAASGLTHVNLISVYDFDVGKCGAPYLVMEYLPGKSLADLIAEQGCIGVSRAMDLFLQIADAIEHAHQKGVLHRDIKPTNIIVEKMENGVELVKLFDFGIAKVLATENLATQGLTQTGSVIGSPLYMSPEQGLGNHVDARSDIYAFGCVMYETLYGRPPFRAENPIRTIMKHINDVPRQINSEEGGQSVPDGLQYIVFHCLEKEPLDRYQSMHYLKNDLILENEHKSIFQYKKTTMSKDEALRAAQLELSLKNFELNSLKQQDSVSGMRYMFKVPDALNRLLPLLFLGYAIWFASFLSQLYFKQGVSTKDSTSETNSISSRYSGSAVAKYEDLANHYETLGQYEKALPLRKLAWEDCRAKPQHAEHLVVSTLRYSYILRQLHRDAEAEQVEATLLHK